jgi:hypothetical protein
MRGVAPQTVTMYKARFHVKVAETVVTPSTLSSRLTNHPR